MIKKRKKDIFEEKNITVIDNETGEILDNKIINSIISQEKKEEIRNLLIKFQDNKNDLNSDEILTVSKILYRKGLNLDEYDSFESYFTCNTNLMLKTAKELKAITLQVFIKLTEFSNKSNTIQFNNHKNIVNDTDFAAKLNLDIRKWREIKKELLQYKAIRKLKFDAITMYKINPSLLGHSMKITLCSYYAFRDELKSNLNSLKILYWDKKLIEEFGIDALKTKKRFDVDN